MALPVVFSGAQPSGCLQLGNYLGAIKNWVALQDNYNCTFCVVDLHAITTKSCTPEKLRQNIINTAATYIACGIEANKSVIFCQSAVPAHSELCWILGCLTPMGWLNRMTQFKSKSAGDKSKELLGLFNYPVLMAADILIYKAEYIPVGDDQRQHLELTREIANTFNSYYGVQYFQLPQPLMVDAVARVMSLKDGTKKMSKSDPVDGSRINLTDSNDLISNKIKKARTDSISGFDVNSLKTRPEVFNLINILSNLTNKNVESVCNDLNGFGMEHLKSQLTEVIIATIAPIREKVFQLQADESYIKSILNSGAEKMQVIAEKNIKEIREIVGFIN